MNVRNKYPSLVPHPSEHSNGWISFEEVEYLTPHTLRIKLILTFKDEPLPERLLDF